MTTIIDIRIARTEEYDYINMHNYMNKLYFIGEEKCFILFI